MQEIKYIIIRLWRIYFIHMPLAWKRRPVSHIYGTVAVKSRNMELDLRIKIYGIFVASNRKWNTSHLFCYLFHFHQVDFLCEYLHSVLLLLTTTKLALIPVTAVIFKIVLYKTGKKFRSLSGRVVSFQGKNVKINIPLTNPSRTFSALTDLVWEDLVNQSKKSGSETSMNKLSVNKTKLHHAEKMIRGAFIELYKGLGYLRTYR